MPAPPLITRCDIPHIHLHAQKFQWTPNMKRGEKLCASSAWKVSKFLCAYSWQSHSVFIARVLRFWRVVVAKLEKCPIRCTLFNCVLAIGKKGCADLLAVLTCRTIAFYDAWNLRTTARSTSQRNPVVHHKDIVFAFFFCCVLLKFMRNVFTLLWIHPCRDWKDQLQRYAVALWAMQKLWPLRYNDIKC